MATKTKTLYKEVQKGDIVTKNNTTFKVVSVSKKGIATVKKTGKGNSKSIKINPREFI